MEDDIGNLEEEVKIDEIKLEQNQNPTFLPQNQNNSCFLDSLLMALFYNRCIFLDFCFLNAILQSEQSSTRWIFGSDSKTDLNKRKEIQKILKNIVKSIRHEKSNTNSFIATLRELISQCNFKALKNTNTQQEAMECLYILTEILQLNTKFNQQTTQVFGTNDLLYAIPTQQTETTNRSETCSCVLHLSEWNKDWNEFLLVTSLDSGMLKEGFTSDGKVYQRQLTFIKYVPKNSFFIIHLDRTVKNPPNIDSNSIFLEEYLMDFNLTSIILHNGTNIHSGHYTCLIKKESFWFLYDDTIKDLTKFINFNEAITKTSANEKCVLLLFTR